MSYGPPKNTKRGEALSVDNATRIIEQARKIIKGS
jgi:hypothetical protein